MNRASNSSPAGADQTAPLLVLCAASLLITFGWRAREELYFLPDTGLGYDLGIAGLAMMLLGLLYSLRKRIRILSSLGDIRHWFRIHVALGIAGPTAILFHANFHLGSMNSSIALVCTLVVAGSGTIGLLAYTRVHHALTGRRTTLLEIQRGADARRDALERLGAGAQELSSQLQAFESYALAPSRSTLGALWRFISIGCRARSSARAALRAARAALREQPSSRLQLQDARRAICAYVSAVRRVATFTAYERIFSLWHALHIPLCVLLFGSAAVHVIAVHMY